MNANYIYEVRSFDSEVEVDFEFVFDFLLSFHPDIGDKVGYL